MTALRELIVLGKQYFDRKEYGQAEHYLRKAIGEAPKYADVHNLLGVIYHIAGRFDAAMEAFRQALKINPNYTEATLNLAVLYNDLGQYQEAKKLYSRLKHGKASGTQVEPVLRGKLSNLHAELGDIYRSIGLNDFAVAEYAKALHLNPDYLDIRTKLGQALRESNDLSASQKELEKVIKTKNNYVPAHIQLGVTLYSMGKRDAARKEWRTALIQSPGDQYAKMYLRLVDAQEQGEKSRKKKGGLYALKRKTRRDPPRKHI